MTIELRSTFGTAHSGGMSENHNIDGSITPAFTKMARDLNPDHNLKSETSLSLDSGFTPGGMG